MAFKAKDLSVLAYNNGFTLWHYKTPDTKINMLRYFDDASDMLYPGDFILTNLDVDRVVQAEIFVVVISVPGRVEVARAGLK